VTTVFSTLFLSLLALSSSQTVQWKVLLINSLDLAVVVFRENTEASNIRRSSKLLFVHSSLEETGASWNIRKLW